MAPPLHASLLRPLAEAMEERILHSADLGPLLLGSDVNDSRVVDATNAAAQVQGNEIAFIDAALPDADGLRADLLAQQAAGRPIEIVTIAAGEDGLALITGTLAGRSGISAVHVLAHGSDGQLQLGSTILDTQMLLQRAGEIAGWSSSLTTEADLLLYGCDLGGTAVGQRLVQDLAALTGADVAASSDATGAAAHGGNWTLELQTGRIEAALALSLAEQARWQGLMATYTVTTTIDVVGNNLLGGSLRWAISQANANAGTDTIVFAVNGTFNVLAGSTGGDDNKDGDFDITGSVNLVGNGSGSTVINGNGLDRVFDVRSGTVSLSGLTIQGGASNSGGGLQIGNTAAVTLTDVVVKNNVGKGASKGAGILLDGSLTLRNVLIQGNGNSTSGDTDGAGLYAGSGTVLDARNVEFRDNIAAGSKDGGGLYIDGGAEVTLENVTFAGNQAKRGGGLWNHSNFTTAVNVTFSGNSATDQGGGIWADRSITLDHVTVANNASAGGSGTGGGVYDKGGYVTTRNSLFAGNSGGNTSRALISQGYNLSDDASPGFTAAGDRAGAAAGLLPLAANGGFTRTQAIGATSLARDAANPVTALGADQRGTAYLGRADIGAYEFNSGGAAPTLDAIADQVADEDASLVVNFTVGDADTAVGSLLVSASSSNLALLPNAGVVVGGSGANRTITLTPAANANSTRNGGPATITVSVSDGSNVTTHSFKVTVTALPDAPVAVDDVASTPSNTAVTVAVRGNDSDVDGDVFVVQAAWLLDGANGSVVFDNGTITYTPSPSAAGAVLIQYTVFDGSLVSNTATLTVNVGANNAPTGSNSTRALLEDTVATLSVADFGYSDPDSHALGAVRIDSLPGAGNLRLNGTALASAGLVVSAADLAAGRLTFTPAADANGAGYASFSFSVQDSQGAYAIAPSTISFDVTPVADAPRPIDDSAGTPINQAVNVRVLDNDSHPDGLGLTLIGATLDDPSQGTVAISTALDPRGSVLFTPAANLSGPVLIHYTVSDSASATANADLTVNVSTNTAPTSADKTVTMAEDSAYAVQSADIAYADPDLGQSMSGLRIERLPTVGSLWIGGIAAEIGDSITAAQLGAGDLVFQPAANGNGTGYDNFGFSVVDSGGLRSASYTLAFDVTPVNDAPLASGSATLAAVDEDTLAPTGATVASLFSSNFSDPADAGNPAQNQFAGVAISGQTVVAAQGRWQYSTNGGASWASFGAINDASAVALATTDRLRFLPGADFNGTPNSLSVRLIDNSTTVTSGATIDVSGFGGTSAFSTGTVTLATSINAVNDPPVITSNGGGANASVSVAENRTAVTTVTATDVEGSPLLYSIAGGADAARFAIDSSTGALRFVVPPNYEAPADVGINNVYEVTVRASDGSLYADQAIAVTVTDVTEALHTTGEQRVNTVISGTQETSAADRGSPRAVAMSPAGDYVVVWSSQGQDGSGWGVYGQRYDKTGAKLGGEIAINQFTTGDQVWATVAMDVSGRFVVSWTSANQDGTLQSVYARRFAADGTASGGEFRVNTTATGSQYNSSVAMDANGNFIVVWQGNGPGDSNGIFGRRFSANGTAIDAAEFRVNTDLARAHYDASVSMNASGAFAVTWDNNVGVLLRRYDSGGVAIGGEINVDFGLNAGNGSIALADNGSLAVVWRDTVLDKGVYLQHYSAAGAPIGPKVTVNTTTAFDQTDPSIAIDGSGNIIVAWEGNGTGDTNGVFAQKFNAAGVAVGGEFRINTTTSGNQAKVSLAMLDLNNFVAVWSGQAAGDGTGVSVRQYGTLSYAPVITSNGGGETAAINVAENTTAVTTVTATDADLPAQTLTYSISGTDMARFAIGSSSGVLSFASAPNFEMPTDVDGDNVYDVTVTVSDGTLTATQTFAITVTDVLGAPGAATGTLWFSTATAQAPAAGGTTWSAGQVLQYGNFGDRFDIDGGATTGTVDVLPGFTAPAPLRGMHYVQTSITIGTTGTKFTLNPGDLLLVLDPAPSASVMLNTGDGNASNDFAADRQDIVVYRPTVAGNYASGEYFMLLNNGVKNGGTTYNVHAISLVETATNVGGVMLPAGTFVVSHSNTSLHYNVYTFTAAGTGLATTQTSNTSPLLYLTGAAFDGNTDQIQGLHLLSTPTAFNDSVLPAGTLLVAVKGTHANFGGTAQDSFDIVALNVTRTQLNGGTLATGQLLFDGSDLGLSSSTNLNGFTVVTGAVSNSAPAVATPIADQMATEDLAFSYTVPAGTFADADTGDTLTYSVTLTGGGALPAWLSFNPGTRQFSGTPLDAQVGAIGVRVIATDSGGAVATSDFTLTVVNVNDAPAGTNRTVVINEDTAYPFSAADFGFTDPNDGTPNTLLAVRISTLPTAGALTNNGLVVSAGQLISATDIAAGWLVFTPTANANGAGYASFTFQVQDDGGIANGGVDLDPTPNTWIVDVTAVNDAPIASGTATLAAVNEDTLSPGGATVASLFSANFSDPADAGNPAHNQFAGVAVRGQAVDLSEGRWQYSINGGTSWSNFNFISDTNAVALGLSDRLRFLPTADYNGTPNNLSLRLIDNSTSVTGGAAINVGGNGGASAYSAATVSLMTSINAVNDAPVASATSASGAEDTLLAVSLGATDVDGSIASFTVQALPANGTLYLDAARTTAVTAGTAYAASGNALTLYFLPDANWNGSTSFDFVATDNGNPAPGLASAVASANLTVTPVNDAPVAAAASAIGTEDSLLAITLSGSDVDGTIASFTVSPLPANGTLFLDAARSTAVVAGTAYLASGDALTLYFSPAANWNGGTSFTFFATDDLGLAGTAATASLTITAVNDAPVAADANASTDENAVLNANVPAASDVDGTVASYALVSSVGTGNGSLVFNADGTYTFDPGSDFDALAAGASRDVSFTYTAIDNVGQASATATVTVTVNGSNDAPVAADASVATSENTALNASVPAASDVDGTVASYALASGVGAGNGSLVFNADGSYVFNPGSDFDALAAGASRDVSFTYTAIDNLGQASAAATVTVTVNGSNDAPVAASPIADQSATEDMAFYFVLPAGTFGDADVGDTLSYSARLSSGAALPSWLHFDATTRIFSGTPDNDDVGMLTVRVTATDSANATAIGDFTLAVANTNDAPLLARPIASQAAAHDAAFSFTLPAATFIDIDAGDTLTYSAALASGGPLPSWLVFDGATLSFHGTPQASDAGQLIVRLTATDTSGASAQAMFVIRVASTPATTPALLLPPPATTPLGVVPVNAAPNTPTARSQTTAPVSVAPGRSVGGSFLDIGGGISGLNAIVTRTHADGADALRTASRYDAVLADAVALAFTDLESSPLSQLLHKDDLQRKFDEMLRQMNEASDARRLLAETGMVLSAGLSIGYVVWLVRGGVLISSMMSALPAWQMIDPMPILAAARKSGRKTALDAEEPAVERLFDDAPSSRDGGRNATPARKHSRIATPSPAPAAVGSADRQPATEVSP